MKKSVWVLPVLLVVGGLVLLSRSREREEVVTAKRSTERNEVAIAGAIPVRVKVQGRTPLETGEKFLEANREALGLKDYHELKPEVYRTPLGAQVVYEVLQDGVPVIGASIRLRMNREMEVVDLENEYHPYEKVSVDPKLTPAEALEIVAEKYDFSPTDETLAFTAKILYVGRQATEKPELAYVMPMKDCGARASLCQVVLRASDGVVLTKSFSRAEF